MACTAERRTRSSVCCTRGDTGVHEFGCTKLGRKVETVAHDKPAGIGEQPADHLAARLELHERIEEGAPLAARLRHRQAIDEELRTGVARPAQCFDGERRVLAARADERHDVLENQPAREPTQADREHPPQVIGVGAVTGAIGAHEHLGDASAVLPVGAAFDERHEFVEDPGDDVRAARRIEFREQCFERHAALRCTLLRVDRETREWRGSQHVGESRVGVVGGRNATQAGTDDGAGEGVGGRPVQGLAGQLFRDGQQFGW